MSDESDHGDVSEHLGIWFFVNLFITDMDDTCFDVVALVFTYELAVIPEKKIWVVVRICLPFDVLSVWYITSVST